MNTQEIIAANLDKYLYVFSDCIPVLGARQSAICDLTRQELYHFPSAYFPFFELFAKQPIRAFYEHFSSEGDQENFELFVAFLLENELGLFFEDLALFPAIEKKWESNNVVNNSIIDVRDKLHDFNSIFNQLNALNCAFIQLRFYSNVFSLDEIKAVLDLAYDKSILSVDLLLMYNEKITIEDYVRMFENYHIISSLTIHSSPFDEIVTTNFGYNGTNMIINATVEKEIVFTTQRVDSCGHCGIVNKKYLSISDVHNFMENVACNGCLNEKISIDENGFIKNCPSMKQHFGHVSTRKLADTVQDTEFKKLWHITKDEIDVCKDCELRYLCTDCRAYTEAPENLYAKPLKCGYDPYTNVWETWSENPLKQKAAAYYNI